MKRRSPGSRRSSGLLGKTPVGSTPSGRPVLWIGAPPRRFCEKSPGRPIRQFLRPWSPVTGGMAMIALPAFDVARAPQLQRGNTAHRLDPLAVAWRFSKWCTTFLPEMSFTSGMQ
jgi:hypothetical protein